MRAIACPDSLKGTLSAHEAAAALAAGLRHGGVEAEELPLADGGEGTSDALYRALGGEWRQARVADPLGRPVAARFLLLPDGRAVVESAEAIGLHLVGPEERDPLASTSRGLGELVVAALEAGARGLLVALGGSATVDGGSGLREVVSELPVPTFAACDVTNPLLGPRGAARVFGPQKGATPEQVEELERRLGSMSELAGVADLPGAGAAGGLGAAFAALGARLVPGIELVLDVVGFRKRIIGTTLAVTGEGKVDASSAEGKVPGGVAAACAAEGVSCVVFGGVVEPDGEAALRALGAAAVLPLSGRAERVREDLEALGESLARDPAGVVCHNQS